MCGDGPGTYRFSTTATPARYSQVQGRFQCSASSNRTTLWPPSSQRTEHFRKCVLRNAGPRSTRTGSTAKSKITDQVMPIVWTIVGPVSTLLPPLFLIYHICSILIYCICLVTWQSTAMRILLCRGHIPLSTELTQINFSVPCLWRIRSFEKCILLNAGPRSTRTGSTAKS
jgi:hypothetical protein